MELGALVVTQIVEGQRKLTDLPKAGSQSPRPPG